MGGSSKYVFKRIVEWGNGWMPVRATVEQLKQGRATLNEMAEKAGRDPKSIGMLAFGTAGRFRERAEIAELEHAGISDVTIWLSQTGKEVAEAEDLARRLLS